MARRVGSDRAKKVVSRSCITNTLYNPSAIVKRPLGKWSCWSVSLPSVSDPDADEPVVVPIEPEIDLHSFQPRDVVDVAVEYITAAHAAGLREVRLAHGRGRGVQRALVQRALAAHPLVDTIWDDPRAHLGATIARLVP
jgi:Smr domain